MPTTLDIRVRHQVNTGADVPYSTHPEEFITMDLTELRDYLIHTAGSDVVKDHGYEPTSEQLSAAALVIDDVDDVVVPLCLLMDYSGAPYKTHKVLGMGINKRYVYCFSFSGATATKPRLEAWDTSAHNSISKYVLGAEITKNIVSSTNATPIVITIPTHGYSTGNTIQILGHTINTNANGTWIITKIGDNTFSLDGSVGNGVGGATGTARKLYPINSMVKAVRTTDGLPGENWAGTPIAGALNYIELDTTPLSVAKDLYCNLKIKIPANYPIPAAETFCLVCRFTFA